MTASAPLNPDQLLLHRFAAGHDGPLAVQSNPLAEALGCQLLGLAEGVIELGFEPQPLFIQGAGLVQGGAISTMLDFAMAFAVLLQLPAGSGCATVNMSVNLMRAAPRARYRAFGEVERRSRTLAFARARLLRFDDGELVASATSTLALR